MNAAHRRVTTNTPANLFNTIHSLLHSLPIAYPNLNIIALGDLQHTIAQNTLHRMGQHLPPQRFNILTILTQPPLLLKSVIPTNHPLLPYHTWHSHSGPGKAGLDHILARQCLIYIG